MKTTSIRIITTFACAALLASCVSASKYEALEKQYADAQTRLTEAEERAAAGAAKIETLESEAAKSVAAAAESRKKIESLEARLAASEKALAENQAKQKALESRNADLEKETQKKLTEQEKKLTAEIAELKKQLKDQASSAATAQNRGVTENADAQGSAAIAEVLGKELAAQGVQITRVENQVTLLIDERVFFDSGSALLKPESRDVLGRIAAVLKRFPDRRIYVEGHTDDREIGSKIRAKYPTNWELAAARAVMVVRYLVEDADLAENRFAALSHSRNRPVASNDTAEGRAKNRRIEIVIVEPGAKK